MKADPLPRLTILSEGERRVVTCDEGLSLRDVLDTTDIKVRSGCNGSGACGLCRVTIEAGAQASPPATSWLCSPGRSLQTTYVLPAG